mgnify:FL=1
MIPVWVHGPESSGVFQLDHEGGESRLLFFVRVGDNFRMRALIWVFRLFIFLLLFGFAVKNDDVVVLRFFFGAQWQVPLVLVILLFVVVGVLIGVTATLATVYRQHREIGQLRGKNEEGTKSDRQNPLPLAHGPDLPESY